MASLGPFFENVKPAMDAFLRSSTLKNLQRLEDELYIFNWLEFKIVHVQILLPLVLKLEELNGKDLELRTGLLNCIRLVLSNVFVKEVKGLCTILTIVLKQLRDFENTKMLPNLSEEIKLAAVLCIAEALKRSTSDVLEEFYKKDYTALQGQVLLTLVEIMELEKYRMLRLKAIECLMVVFYVYDKAETTDIVLRCQVADALFLYLPKILGVLFKVAISDDKLGETLKSTAVKALGRVLNIIYEDTNDPEAKRYLDSKEFKKLLEKLKDSQPEDTLPHILIGSKIKKDQLKDHLTRMQNKGRSSHWFRETSARLSSIFKQLKILCSHPSPRIRKEYAHMCITLSENCTQNLKENFIILLENLIALSEDEDESISELCRKSLKSLCKNKTNVTIFDECADMLFEEHSTKLVQILHRKDEYELYVELLFLKGFLKNIEPKKLYSLFSLSSYMENFFMALITAVDLEITRDLLNEEYALRQFNEVDYSECSKFHWRKFKFIESDRCKVTVEEICSILGTTAQVNRLTFDYLLDLLQTQQHRMNEALLIMIWIFAPSKKIKENKQFKFLESILEYILNDEHWHLALTPDAVAHLKVHKPSYWFVDRVPGLYESGVEVRIQDYDSDDEEMEDPYERVNILDVQQNVLHTCVILDVLGHCAMAMSMAFEKYIFHSLHKVLLKVASSNTMIYKAAMFSLVSIQKATGYKQISEFIEAHTDYLSYHLNMILRRTPESSSAVDILSVVLQLSSRNTLPHLESIFETIRNECSKAQQEQHISAYLRVFNAFLMNVDRWKMDYIKEVNSKMVVDDSITVSDDILTIWLQILEKPNENETNEMETDNTENEKEENDTEKNIESQGDDDTKEQMDIKSSNELPRHIDIIKGIMTQSLKFITSSSQAHQIQSLECLIAGIPLLKDYEDELLPLVHNIWQPLMEKFRQKDPLVLNRCFTLLSHLSTHAKGFILKRSLDDVIPYLKYFLKDSASYSAVEHSTAQTQMYKLQLKLLKEFSNLIVSMKIDGKHLNDITEVISIYLSQKQPKELQANALQFFLRLKNFNGPLMYLIAIKRCHLKEYKDNVDKIMAEFHVSKNAIEEI